MFTLKNYQVQTIDAVRRFMAECNDGRAPSEVFADFARGLGVTKAKYHDPFDGIPCVCVKVPTGGGKTVIAAASIEAIDTAYTQTGHPFVLWLTPSDAITQQTVRALKDPDHPYCQAVSKTFPGVQVLSIEDAETLPQCDFSKSIILVSTIQTFNIANTAQRNAYGFNEAYESFFSGLSASDCEGLERVSERDLTGEAEEGGATVTVLTRRDIGRVKYSLANIIALQRPIVIVDEAHNNRTDKFFRTLNRLMPAAVLELTATPVSSLNNVIHQVSAWELKTAEMVKLPIVLRGYDTEWTTCLEETLALRKDLEKKALSENEYLRPILLIQAQANAKDALPGAPTPEVVKSVLVKKFGILEEEIAVATGTTRDLDGLDLMSPACPIRYVITIKALKEGWDCPFAYVLCSLQNIRSAKDVEQLLGRVMRMPYAKRRIDESLNRAYASVISPYTYETANILTSRLVESLGFDETAAASLIEAPEPDQGTLFGANDETQIVIEVTSETDVASIVVDVGLGGVVRVEDLPAPTRPSRTESAPTGSETAESAAPKHPEKKKVLVTLPAGLPEQKFRNFQTRVIETQPVSGQKAVSQSFGTYRIDEMRLAARARQEELPLFSVPALCFKDGDVVRPVSGVRQDSWRPLDFGLDGLKFLPRKNTVSASLIDVESATHRLQSETTAEDKAQMSSADLLFNLETRREDLIRTLAYRLQEPGVRQPDMCKFVDAALTSLARYDLTTLVRNLVPLSNALKRQLKINFEKAGKQGFQEQLDLSCPDPEATYDFRFDPNKYPARNLYDPRAGGRVFKKHYYEVIDDLRHKTPNGRVTEEYRCAEAIELNPNVQTWVRNIPKADGAFFLALSGGRRFYPDFVAKLVDGRVLVVEYKGEALATNDDSKEKRRVGEIWAQASGGRGLFLFAEKTDAEGRNLAAQIDAAIHGY